MNERIKELRKKLNLTQEEFSSNIELSRNFIAQIESGAKSPSERTIKDICRIYKVNYQWLLHGIGEMFQEDDSDAQAIVDSVMTGDNDFAKKTLVKLSKLSEEHWKLLKEIFEELLDE